MGGGEGRELEGGDGACVQVEGCYGGSWQVVFEVRVEIFGFDGGGLGRGIAGLGGIENAEVAKFVAGEDEGFVGRRVESEGVDALRGYFYSS